MSHIMSLEKSKHNTVSFIKEIHEMRSIKKEEMHSHTYAIKKKKRET